MLICALAVMYSAKDPSERLSPLPSHIVAREQGSSGDGRGAVEPLTSVGVSSHAVSHFDQVPVDPGAERLHHAAVVTAGGSAFRGDEFNMFLVGGVDRGGHGLDHDAAIRELWPGGIGNHFGPLWAENLDGLSMVVGKPEDRPPDDCVRMATDVISQEVEEKGEGHGHRETDVRGRSEYL